MTPLVRRQLDDLAAVLAGLKDRVRAAVAGELSRAVGDAAREVVRAVVVGGRAAAPPRPAPRGRWDDDGGRGRPRDPWACDEDDHPARSHPAARATAAVIAGTAVARWWAARAGGGLLAAAGVGLGVGLAGLLGGPLARTAVAVLAAAADVLAATDALGAGAARLGHV